MRALCRQTRVMRILIHLAQPGPVPPPVARLLREVGATAPSPSHAELPGLCTADLPESADLDALLRRLNAVPGVRHAEADAWGQSF